jgi:hypothetical protein
LSSGFCPRGSRAPGLIARGSSKDEAIHAVGKHAALSQRNPPNPPPPPSKTTLRPPHQTARASSIGPRDPGWRSERPMPRCRGSRGSYAEHLHQRVDRQLTGSRRAGRHPSDQEKMVALADTDARCGRRLTLPRTGSQESHGAYPLASVSLEGKPIMGETGGVQLAVVSEGHSNRAPKPVRGGILRCARRPGRSAISQLRPSTRARRRPRGPTARGEVITVYGTRTSDAPAVAATRLHRAVMLCVPKVDGSLPCARRRGCGRGGR